MPLESAATIEFLDVTNPNETDSIGQADDHIRLIKSALKGTFASITGTTVANTADLDWVHTNRATIDTQRAKAVYTDAAAVSLPGTLSVTTSINSASLLQAGVPLVPRGVIVMWSGALNAIPAGWALCDGSSGTPNLVGLFVAAAGGTVGAFATGGAASVTPTTAFAGTHNHSAITGLAGSHGHTASADSQGTHSHAAVTGGHSITPAEMPSHDHNMGSVQVGIADAAAGTMSWSGGPAVSVHSFVPQGGDQPHQHGIVPDGSHLHNVSVAGAGDHQHSVGNDGSHQHTITVATLPPYVALGFIMKL